MEDISELLLSSLFLQGIGAGLFFSEQPFLFFESSGLAFKSS